MPGLIERALNHENRIAIRQGDRSWQYQMLLKDSASLAWLLTSISGDLTGKRIAFLVQPGYHYVRVQWAIWRCQAVAVPLCTDHPAPALQYVLEDTTATLLIHERGFSDRVSGLTLSSGGIKLQLPEVNEVPAGSSSDLSVAPEWPAMILHTSGTTNKPKGVVITHGNLIAQMRMLEKAWGWSSNDEILCVLPLHHIHGIVNVAGCALWSGACCRFLEGSFSADAVFDTFLQTSVNVFMAVPTIYYKLIAAWEQYPEDRRNRISRRLNTFRLMVCGSAALPVSVMEKWEQISGHRLLERYGMTEIGMALSNPLTGERRAGSVGAPLPGVDVRLCDEQDQPIEPGVPGEIQVKGETVFRQYWNRPEATTTAFTSDGWFRTGDVAVVEEGYYRILGRNSVDIIKSGGYKISALEIEEVLRSHPAIADCCVVGLPNEEWGETVAAAIIVREPLEPSSINTWLRERMPAYRIPRTFLMTDSLPRNAMGKVMKPEVKKLFNQP